jgi:beta-N-acetylhexosaminidase
MGAITSVYSSGRAAVAAIEAGCDLLLMPEDLDGAAEGIQSAVESGELTEERIDESVLRILTVKVEKEIC